MPLTVLPLGGDEAGLLTMQEWDLLRSARLVLFEDPGHPLIERLRDAEVAAGPFDDEPGVGDEGLVLVTRPSSPRLAELASAGARVVVGPADPPDGLAGARGAYVARRAAASLATLATVMARLRGPDGCPWDAEQTHRSLQVHLIEEAYEVIETIEAGDLGAPLEEELGDLLLQVVFHAQMAADDDRFDLAGIADVLVAKLIRRHPHVFGDSVVTGAGEVVRNWETIKASEKETSGADPFAGIPRALPALLAAYKTQKKAARFGFSADGATARRELSRAASAAEPDVGTVLFWAVALARATGVDPESALRQELRSFRARLT